MRLLALAALTILFFAPPAFAQEDVTPPVLLDFTISPVAFDASLGPVTIEACVTAQDDLAGLGIAAVALTDEGGTTFDNTIGAFSGSLIETVCINLTVPQFKPFGIFSVRVVITDGINGREISSADLCALEFVCAIENRLSGDLPDSDEDGVPDDADNCPDDPNEDQADSDLDLIGDVCDPFPNDRDNEQAQCESDLDQVLIQFGECRDSPILPDDDADDVLDTLDNCLGLPNPDQLDTNADGYGNLCDADVNNDGVVGIPDFTAFAPQFGLKVDDPDFDPDFDFNGDNAVGIPDFVLFAPQFGGTPGPSGLYCAGEPGACPAACGP